MQLDRRSKCEVIVDYLQELTTKKYAPFCLFCFRCGWRWVTSHLHSASHCSCSY